MDYLLQIGIFVFGTVIGSFLNVVILRYGEKSLNGRSVCPNCEKTLRWFELVPVLSFVFLRGKCKRCHKKISWQYPLVEFSTGLIFWASFVYAIGLPYVFYLLYLWIIFSLLIVIFVYDLYHKIIPDLLVFAFIGVSLINVIGSLDTLSVSWWSFSLENSLWAGPILAFPFAFLWFISGGRWMGLGDAKLALGIGFFLGLVKGSSAIILGVWIGAAVGLFLIILSKVMKGKRLFFKGKNFTIKSELPFAPFLIIGTLLVFFFGWNVWGLGSFLL